MNPCKSASSKLFQDLRRRRGVTWGAWLGVLSLVIGSGAACSSSCPPGYEKQGSYCRVASKGTDPATGMSVNADTVNAASAASGTGAAQPPANGSGVSGVAGGRAVGPVSGTGASSTGVSATSAQPPIAGAGVSSVATPGIAGSGAAANSGNASVAMGPCAGHENQSVCELAVMHHCDAMGQSVSPESCMSPMLCQVGVAQGACAVCNPGTFRCQGVMLEVCNDAGQYMPKDTCASEALCNDMAGACTAMKCQPNMKSCASDGTLKTCNADGSAFDESQSEACGKDMCDARKLVCFKCTPNAVTCDGLTATTCSADGQTETPKLCAPSSDCVVAACRNGTGCANGGNEAPGKSCSSAGGKQCDGSGRCVECVDDSVCGGKKCVRNKCVQCTVADDCPGETDCTEPVCNANGSCGTPRNKGTTESCGNNGHCDGKGKCTLCGNGVLDSPEQCDKEGTEWKGTGFCSADCKFSSGIYRSCSPDGQGRCASNNPFIFCSAVGACSFLCGSASDCQTSPSARASCMSSGPSVCAIPCSSPGTKGGCPGDLVCVTFQKALADAPISMCGKANFSPPM